MREKNLLMDINYTARLIHRQGRDLLEELGLHWGQPPLLAYLDEKEGASQQEIARALDIRPATLTKMVGRLEEEGYLVRRKDDKDRRLVRVFLTDRARRSLGRLYADMDKKEKEALASFSPQEKDQLARLLKKLRGNLGQDRGGEKEGL